MDYTTTAATTTQTCYLNNSTYNTITTGTGNWSNTWTTTTTPLTSIYDELIKSYNKTKEEDNNKMATNTFNFGAYNTSNIRLSLYGMAIKNKMGKWVSYDVEKHSLIDVEILNFEIDSTKIFYKIPKAIDDIKVGDIILHNEYPVFVERKTGHNKFEVINPYEGTAITILPLTSPFGFNYITQIVSLTDMLPQATKDNPFGNLLPFIIGGNDNLPMILMLMGKDIGDIDPMLLMALNSKNDNLLFILMMMNKKETKQFKHKYRDLDDLLDHRRAMYGPGIEDSEEE